MEHGSLTRKEDPGPSRAEGRHGARALMGRGAYQGAVVVVPDVLTGPSTGCTLGADHTVRPYMRNHSG